jgi:hypothetical protein
VLDGWELGTLLGAGDCVSGSETTLLGFCEGSDDGVDSLGEEEGGADAVGTKVGPRVGTSTADTLSSDVKAAPGEASKMSINFTRASSSAKGAAANSSRSKRSDLVRYVKVISNTKVIASICRRRREIVINTSVTIT